MSELKCPKCGANVKYNVDTGKPYCEHCGYVLEEEKKEAKVVDEVLSTQPAPAENKASVLYDTNGNPVFVQPLQTNQNSPEAIQQKENKKKKKGVFAASIITLALAFVFIALSIVFFFQFVGDADSDIGQALLFIFYLITGIGLVTFVPAMGLSIAALTCSIISIKSTVKAIKVISIILTVISVLVLVVSVILPFFLPSIANIKSSST